MIQANELRIGNWVDAGNYYLYQIKLSHFENTNFDITEPIALLPETLDRCGFKEDTSYSDNDYCTYKIDEDYLLYLEMDWRKRADGWNPMTLADELVTIGVHIKYLHQLQNLYFALTGKELEIKL